MKNSKLNLIILLALFCSAQIQSYGQGDWNTGGNNNTQTGILGSSTNWDILFRTDGINRMRLRETSTTNINGSIINTSGFLGLHTDFPRAMFHIQGPNNTLWGGDGYREWMHTGTYVMENSDNLFVGMKDEAFNRSDAIWAWGDDSTDTRANYTRFIFTLNADADGECITCPTNPRGLYGREIMRLTEAPEARVAIGKTSS
jgi:hypothetical protein